MPPPSPVMRPMPNVRVPRVYAFPLEPLEDRIAPANIGIALSGGGAGDQRIMESGVDAAGNTYVSGTFRGTVDFDPGPGVLNRTATAGNSDALFNTGQYAPGVRLWPNLPAPARARGWM